MKYIVLIVQICIVFRIFSIQIQFFVSINKTP